MRYIPELSDLGLTGQEDAINKHCLVTDTDIFKMLHQHMQTDFINKSLFGEDGTNPTPVTDLYFRGVLDGMQVYYDFVHERAEMQSNTNL